MRRVMFPILALFAFSGGASAVTVNELAFSQTNWQDFSSTNKTVVEDFEGLGAALGGASGAEYTTGFLTGVGTFSRNGGDSGSGGTVTQAGWNTGQGVALRSGNVFGRVDTTSSLLGGEGNWFFDSNDLTNIKWEVNTGSMFDKLIFSLTDAADQGATFSICLDTAPSCDTYQLSGQSPSSKRLVEIDFGAAVSGGTILFDNGPRNDGFGIDDIAVSVLPLPTSALLLLGGLGALGATRARKKRTTA